MKIHLCNVTLFVAVLALSASFFLLNTGSARAVDIGGHVCTNQNCNGSDIRGL